MRYIAAKIDENNVVTEAIVVDGPDITDANGNISDELTTSFANKITEGTGNWKAGGKWSEGSLPAFRNIQPAIGSNWHPGEEKFYLGQPHPSWTLNADLEWEAPIPKPNSTTKWMWNEETNTWDLPDQDFMISNDYDETENEPDNANYKGRIT